MKRMSEAKQKYEDIPIPEELSKQVMLEVEKAQVRYGEKRKKHRMVFVKRGMMAAAVAVALFTAGVNTSEVFARELQNVPVLGTMARIFTFRSYESETEDFKISVDVPGIEMISEELSGLEDSVNEEIHMFCQQYADAAIERAEDYRQAFLDTGGPRRNGKPIILRSRYGMKSSPRQTDISLWQLWGVRTGVLHIVRQNSIILIRKRESGSHLRIYWERIMPGLRNRVCVSR